MDSENLVQRATEAREHAYAPYSSFKVGAALLASNGGVFTGCNVENASYGLTVCAERVALWKAVSEGARDFVALAIAGPSGKETPPCGACRQTLAEFGLGLKVFYRDSGGRLVRRRLSALLPSAFR